jgi:glycosyltransferase involved in cell wall biosynthesis
MIGRGNAKKKRFQIGILSMEYIIKEIINCELYIVSNLTGIEHLQNIVINLNLENNINFIGYSSTPEIFFKNASLNLFPSISESFGLVLCETKIYGIPNILIGLDYLSISKGGTIIVYDDSSESLAKEVIKILIHSSKRKYLGREARKNIKKFNNDFLFIKWMKLVLSVLNGDKYYQILRENDKYIYEEEIFTILNNQIKLLKKRIPNFYNITLNKYVNYTYMKNII